MEREDGPIPRALGLQVASKKVLVDIQTLYDSPNPSQTPSKAELYTWRPGAGKSVRELDIYYIW